MLQRSSLRTLMRDTASTIATSLNFSNASETHSGEIERARADPNAFIEFCFTDERGAPYRQARHHREWQALFGEDRVALLGAAELGKSLQVAFRLVWELGRDPEMRCYVLSAQEENAMKICGVVKRAIEGNERVRLVFPGLAPGRKWTESGLIVAGRKSQTTKDFSLQPYGYHSKFLGIRAERMVIDDVNDGENSRTELSRERVVKWFDEMVQTRLMPEGRAFVIANAWHKEDLVHTLAGREGFVFRRYSVLDETGTKSTWPERFPLSRVIKLRKNLPPLSFARMYMCLPLDDETSRFDEAWFEQAKEKGAGVEYNPASVPVDERGEKWMVFCGVDLASGKRGVKRKTDMSALFTIAYHPKKKVMRVLDVQSGRWKAPEIVARMRALADKWDPVFVIEDVGTQQLFVDSRDLTGLRVVGFTTDQRKWHPTDGIEGMALTFHSGLWIIPSSPMVDADGSRLVHESIEQWLHDLIFFTPAEHTSDIVMSSWIAHTACRTLSRSYFTIQRRIGLT